MAQSDEARYRQATTFFKRGVKVSNAAVHRTVNRPPRGKGWVQCVNAPAGMMCRPEKVRESIEHFKRAYDVCPDIIALNQIALAHEMIGELHAARGYYLLMKEQAEAESDSAYLKTAAWGLERTS